MRKDQQQQQTRTYNSTATYHTLYDITHGVWHTVSIHMKKKKREKEKKNLGKNNIFTEEIINFQHAHISVANSYFEAFVELKISREREKKNNKMW